MLQINFKYFYHSLAFIGQRSVRRKDGRRKRKNLEKAFTFMTGFDYRVHYEPQLSHKSWCVYKIIASALLYLLPHLLSKSIYGVQDIPFIFDFNTREWHRGPSFGNHQPDHCSASIFFEKNTERKVMVLMKTLSKYGYQILSKIIFKNCVSNEKLSLQFWLSRGHRVVSQKPQYFKITSQSFHEMSAKNVFSFDQEVPALQVHPR